MKRIIACYGTLVYPCSWDREGGASFIIFRILLSFNINISFLNIFEVGRQGFYFSKSGIMI